MSRTQSSPIWIILMCTFLFVAPVWPNDRFTDNGDGTVTDHQLGVMWSKTDNQGDINWKEADLWVKYTFPDSLEKKYANWRLPTLAELQSLYIPDKEYEGYETDCGRRVKIVPVIRLSCSRVWSSDTSAIQAYIFNFNRGYHYSDRMVHDKTYRVLPVRDLK